MTMRTLLIFAAIVGLSASAFAQTGAPKVGGKQLKQVKPRAAMGCKLVGTVKGPSSGPATARPRQNFGAPHPQPSPKRQRRPPKQIPRLRNNKVAKPSRAAFAGGPNRV